MSPESLCFYMLSVLFGLVAMCAYLALRALLWLLSAFASRFGGRVPRPTAAELAARRRRVERDLRFHLVSVVPHSQTPNEEVRQW